MFGNRHLFSPSFTKKKKKMFSDCPLRLGPGHQRITVARAMEVDKAAVRMV